ncbi:hypothetical protein [Deinococcus aquiradiocola]|uniref:Uncharacterized protein n=1 Tax=Deinococcus aquiradiocola TaxID=393059 RepID=A0A917PLT6_9DEIO|nr:hypothetical protein [Deinococcus aquiradiocola]GGJ83745.1 hypothetical protein GCM10008939_29470 [Deinococcus aquiradiocola]
MTLLNIGDHLKNVLELSEAHCDKTINNGDIEFSQLYSYIEDLKKWLSIIGGQVENIEMFRSAFKEFEASCHLASFGYLRPSYFSLRFFLEHSLWALCLSTSQIDYRNWVKGNLDFNWGFVQEHDRSVTSKAFAAAYLPEFEIESGTYREYSARMYRECSEFVHGNYKIYKEVHSEEDFDVKSLTRWKARAQLVFVVVTFFISLRFLNSLNSDTIKENSHLVMDHLGHIEVVRLYMEGRNNG